MFRTGQYYMSCLSSVLQLLTAREPKTDTIIHIDYHEKNISLSPGSEFGYIPSGAEMHIDWAAWLGRELGDDKALELWVYIDRDGWEVMSVEGADGNVTDSVKFHLPAATDPSIIADQLHDILTGRRSLSSFDSPVRPGDGVGDEQLALELVRAWGVSLGDDEDGEAGARFIDLLESLPPDSEPYDPDPGLRSMFGLIRGLNYMLERYYETKAEHQLILDALTDAMRLLASTLNDRGHYTDIPDIRPH